MRVFSDRLIEESDKNWLHTRLHKELPNTVNLTLKKMENLCFTSIINGNYELLVSEDELGLVLLDKLAEFSS